jgi:hypothetical protein
MLSQQPHEGDVPTGVLLDGSCAVALGKDLFLIIRERLKPGLLANAAGEDRWGEPEEEVAQHVVAGVSEPSQGALETMSLTKGLATATPNWQVAQGLAKAQRGDVGPLVPFEVQVMLLHGDHRQPGGCTLGGASLDSRAEGRISIGCDERLVPLLAICLAPAVPPLLELLDLLSWVGWKIHVLSADEVCERARDLSRAFQLHLRAICEPAKLEPTETAGEFTGFVEALTDLLTLRQEHRGQAVPQYIVKGT